MNTTAENLLGPKGCTHPKFCQFMQQLAQDGINRLLGISL